MIRDYPREGETLPDFHRRLIKERNYSAAEINRHMNYLRREQVLDQLTRDAELAVTLVQLKVVLINVIAMLRRSDP